MNVNVFAGEWMSEWSVDGMNVIVLKTELFSVAMKHIYIYYDRSVCERPERDKRERRQE